MQRATRIKNIIDDVLQPDFIQIINESFMHHVPDNSETHFKLIIVSKAFQNQKLITRHRVVNDLLQAEFDNGLHALSMNLFTPTEWKSKTNISQSPSCRDGYNK